MLVAEDGSELNAETAFALTEQGSTLEALFEMHKIPGRLRAGEDWDIGRFKLSDALEKSNSYRDFVESREVMPGWSGINFKTGEDVLLSPWEMTAKALSEAHEEHVVKYDRIGFEGLYLNQ